MTLQAKAASNAKTSRLLSEWRSNRRATKKYNQSTKKDEQKTVSNRLEGDTYVPMGHGETVQGVGGNNNER